MKNQAAFMTDTKQIQIRDIEMPSLNDDDVLVKIQHIGICGSDIHFFENGKIDNKRLPFPIVLGHECAGEVIEVGKNVIHFKAGDKVALEPGVPCGKCALCKEGKYNLCPDVEFMAAPPNFNGALKRYLSHPQQMTFKLKDNLDTIEGALLEPLSVGLHAARQGNAGFGKSVVILGAGCIGLMVLIACRIMGVANITVADLFEKRLEKAKEFGATTVIDVSEADVIDSVLKNTDGLGADIVFETAGTSITTSQTGFIVKRGGTIVLVGNTFGETSFNFFNIINKEVEIKTVFRYRNIYPMAIEAVSSGKADIKKIVSQIFDFEETQKAFDCVIQNKKEMIKGMIKL